MPSLALWPGGEVVAVACGKNGGLGRRLGRLAGAARIAVRAVRQAVTEVAEVRFVLLGAEVYRVFAAALSAGADDSVGG